MKKLFIIIFAFIEMFSANAQMYMEIVSPLKHLGSVASKDVINDKEGNPCAKIMVEISVDSLIFSNPWMMGPATKRTGRYECFVSVQKNSKTEMIINHPNYGNVTIPLWCEGQSLVPREAYHVKIETKVFESFAEKYAERQLNNENQENQTTIPDVFELNTEHVNNMSGMFRHCCNLEELNLSHFDTSNVVDMSSMFKDCSRLSTLDISSFNTHNVTNMSSMFANCTSLMSIDFKNFDTSNVTNMSRMFSGCLFHSIDIRNFDTSNVYTMRGMFSYCFELISLDLNNLKTSNVEDMSFMFDRCGKIVSLDLSSFNTSKVTSFENMFKSCRLLETLDLSNFEISENANCREMFSDCRKLRTIIVKNCNAATIDKIKRQLIQATSPNQVQIIM